MRRLSLIALLLLAGCQPGGDFARPGTWQATGVNDRNLRSMLAEPAHATRGVAAQEERGSAGSMPVGRLLRDERRALPPPGRGFGPGGGDGR
ncbi:hypothetical protein [Roseomonas sp. WA12]